MTVHLAPPLERLFAELEADHAFGSEVVEPMRAAARSLTREADDSHDAMMMAQAIALVADQPRPARDRLRDIIEIIEARGKVVVKIQRM
jgi:hypothetical protein